MKKNNAVIASVSHASSALNVNELMEFAGTSQPQSHEPSFKLLNEQTKLSLKSEDYHGVMLRSGEESY